MDAIKYTFKLNQDVVEESALAQSHTALIENLQKTHDVGEIMKISASYMFEFANKEDHERVQIIESILNECRKNGLDNIVPFVTKGLLFFEESSENFKGIIVDYFIPENEREEIDSLMREMEKLSDGGDFEKETLERRSEISTKLSDYQDEINGKIQEAIRMNFNTEQFGNQVH